MSAIQRITGRVVADDFTGLNRSSDDSKYPYYKNARGVCGTVVTDDSCQFCRDFVRDIFPDGVPDGLSLT